ncbi:MAG: hypothetical protein QOI66_1943 [Myxococcales bacterium]|nr:hypothetical protein [Myxococcales bacterium]
MGACALDKTGLDPVDASPNDDVGSSTGGQIANGDAGGGGDVGDDGDLGDVSCAPCGPCQRCGGDGTCQIDPTSRWEIVCVSAAVAASPPGREKWDSPSGKDTGGAAPDPYCQFDTEAVNPSPATAGITDTVTDSFAPGWNEVITPPGQTISAAALLDPNAHWKLTVGDDDGCDANNVCVAENICTVLPPMKSAWLLDGAVSESVAPSCQTLSLRFVCQH